MLVFLSFCLRVQECRQCSPRRREREERRGRLARPVVHCKGVDELGAKHINGGRYVGRGEVAKPLAESHMRVDKRGEKVGASPRVIVARCRRVLLAETRAAEGTGTACLYVSFSTLP